MSDLEEENRVRSRCLSASEWSEDQIGMILDCGAEKLSQARKFYEAIPIPGELNTRVRAVIESDQKRRRHNVWRLIGAGAAALFGICCIMSQIGGGSSQKTKFTEPSQSVTAYPETKEDVTVLQTISENEMSSGEDESGFCENESSFREEESSFRENESGFREEESSFRENESGFREEESSFREEESGFGEDKSGFRKSKSGS